MGFNKIYKAIFISDFNVSELTFFLQLLHELETFSLGATLFFDPFHTTEGSQDYDFLPKRRDLKVFVAQNIKMKLHVTGIKN